MDNAVAFEPVLGMMRDAIVRVLDSPEKERGHRPFLAFLATPLLAQSIGNNVCRYHVTG